MIHSSHPAIAGNAIYFNADAGVAEAFDLATGARLWSTPLGNYVSVDIPVLHRRQVSISGCAPCCLDGRVFVADGSGGLYALAASSGKTLWKADDDGYGFEYASVVGRLYAATDKGFYELDPATGHTVHSYLIAGGAWHCAVSAGRAIITHDPFKNKGWEILDLSTWKPVWSDSSFSPVSPPAVSGGICVCCGYPADHVGETGACTVRAYAGFPP
jgi:outer membrane protein assembly factor BamB